MNDARGARVVDPASGAGVGGDVAEVVDRFYAALASSDLEAARACCAPDAVFWHSFDGVPQDFEQLAAGLAAMFRAVPENRVADVRRMEVGGVLVQRHLFVMRLPGGQSVGKPCCIFVSVREGLITRLDEYVDVAGNLPVEPGSASTPGLPRLPA